MILWTLLLRKNFDFRRSVLKERRNLYTKAACILNAQVLCMAQQKTRVKH
jgi:hypothetical protein